MKRLLLLLVLMVSVGLTSAWGDSIYPLDPNMLDPATLQMGTGAGTTCATGGCPAYNNEVNVFSSTVSMYQNQGGASSLSSPVLLILGVANDASGGTALSGSSISSVSLYSNYPTTSSSSVTWDFGTNLYGLNGSGYQGLFTATSPSAFDPTKTAKDVYDFLGLSGDASNNFGNWSSWDSAVNGINATNFGIYVFALNTDQFASKDLLNVVFGSGAVPNGTFAVGWGAYPNPTNGGDYFSTPFTNAGLTDTTEPATLSLMFAGVLALFGAAVARKRLSVHN